MDSDFENKVKRSFMKVKEHITQLEQKLSENKTILERLFQRVGKSPSDDKIDSTPLKMRINGKTIKSSTGNQGVQTNKQTNNQTNKHSNTQQTNISYPHFGIKIEKIPETTISSTPLDIFSTLTNREFVIFLTIYQLGEATYQDLSNKLSLTNSCIRSYIYSLFSKKAPITRRKINNKRVVLSIDPNFKALTSEQKLIEIYYQRDSNQTTLF